MGRPAHEPAGVITAVLLQITQQAERIASLDEREAGHYRDIAARLAGLAQHLDATGERSSEMHATLARQAAILDSLDGLDQEVAALASRIAAMVDARSRRGGGEDDAYLPPPVPRWWKLTGSERDQALARLRAWVEQVYRPGYGHLAASLGPCWERHPLCLYGWTGSWSRGRSSPVIRTQDLDPGRPGRMAGPAHALAEQMYLETTRCQHAKPPPAGHRLPAGPRTAERGPGPDAGR